MTWGKSPPLFISCFLIRNYAKEYAEWKKMRDGWGRRMEREPVAPHLYIKEFNLRLYRTRSRALDTTGFAKKKYDTEFCAFQALFSISFLEGEIPVPCPTNQQKLNGAKTQRVNCFCQFVMHVMFRCYGILLLAILPILYGLVEARVRQTADAIIVEGEFDSLSFTYE